MDKNLKARLISESSYPGTLSLLLENDVEKAKKSFAAIFKGLQSRKTKMQSLISSMPSGNYQTFMAEMLNQATEPIDAIQKKLGDLSDAEEDAEAAAKEIGVLLDQSEDISRQINHMLKINRGAMSYMAQQVVKSNLHKGDDKDTPMMTILSDAGLEKQAKKELGDAIKKALNSVQIKKKKGFFAGLADKIFGGFSALDVAKESKDEMVDAILEMSPMEIGKFSQEIVNYSEESDKETEKIEQEAEKVLNDIEDEAGATDDKKGSDKLTKLEPEDINRQLIVRFGDRQVFMAEDPEDFEKSLTGGDVTTFHGLMADEKETGAKPDEMDKLTIELVEDDDNPLMKAKLSDVKGSVPEKLMAALDKAILDALEGEEEGSEPYKAFAKQAQYLFDKSKTPKDAGEGGAISRDDLLAKAQSALGDTGGLVLKQLIDTGVFDDFGIKVERSVRKNSLGILFEETLGSEEFDAAYDLAVEEDPDKFKDEKPATIATGLNDLFSEEGIEVEIEAPQADESEELTGEDAELSPDEVEEAEKMADQAENVLGNLPFGKLELTKLLKAFPELSGKGNKATTQRRAFRKAFNQAAGQEIFEEGVQLGAEDQTLTRLRKLAGIS